MGGQGGSATICLDSVACIPSTPGKEGRGLKPVDACTVLRKRVAVMVVSHVVEYVLLGVGVPGTHICGLFAAKCEMR